MAVTQRKRSTPGTTRKAAVKSSATRGSGSQEPRTARAEDEERRKVAMAAYFLAERRGFAPGAELDDWLQAEAQVRGQSRQ